jgi:hypothetical protein
MKHNSQSVQYQRMKSKKNAFIKKKVQLVIPVNRPMDFLKFYNMFFLTI